MKIDVSALWLVAFLLVFARAIAWLMVVSPFSSSSVVPVVVTVAMGAGLALIVTPSVEHSPLPSTTPALLGDLVVQVVTGLAIGFVVQLMLSTVFAAGTYLDQAGGLTLPPSINPLSGTETALMGQFYQQVVVLLLFATNGYLVMIEGFARSFAGPGFSLAATKPIATVVTTDLGVFFASSLEIVAPILVVLFAAQVVLGLVSKAAPQTNVWILGFPLQVFLVLVLVSLTASALPGDLTNLLTRGLGDAARMFGGR